MRDKIRVLWEQSLMSGAYKQGNGTLRTYQDEFCCLGVLSDLYHKKTGLGQWIPVGRKHLFVTGTLSNSTAYLTTEVMEWAGVSDRNPIVLIGNKPRSLSHLNDNGATFADIAQAIRTL